MVRAKSDDDERQGYAWFARLVSTNERLVRWMDAWVDELILYNSGVDLGGLD